MGKLTRKEAEDLHKIGTFDDKTMEVLENEGFVARRARGQKRVMKTKNNSYVTPQFYFRGLSKNGSGEYSKKMEELHTKVHELFNKYTTTFNNK
tara:strand:+ start:332 stop:613 length:282 start_codon:yes stop_codon:yes gene_type:complete